MGTLDFTEFENDHVVIHFGGSLATVDAYTFGNALIAFADTVRAVNNVVNPGQEIEVRLEAQGPGSFRAAVRRVRKGFGGFFSRGLENIFWGIIAALIYEKAFQGDTAPKITVNTNEVIIESHGDRVIVPRTAYEALPNVRKDDRVQNSLSRTFNVLERDESVSAFGLTARIDDPDPILVVPREKFEGLALPVVAQGEEERVRVRDETARLIILKAWLTHKKRKWSFEWNGVPVSALIGAEDFWGKIDRREYLIGSGDALDVVLTFKQKYDDQMKVFVNDPSSFVVKQVVAIIPRAISSL